MENPIGKFGWNVLGGCWSVGFSLSIREKSGDKLECKVFN